MQIGMIGLGRMGASMTKRLLRGNHACVVRDSHPEAKFLRFHLAPHSTAAPSTADFGVGVGECVPFALNDRPSRNDVGVLSEEFAPRTGRMQGNFPQVLSNMALVNTARLLSSSQVEELSRKGERPAAGRAAP